MGFYLNKVINHLYCLRRELLISSMSLNPRCLLSFAKQFSNSNLLHRSPLCFQPQRNYRQIVVEKEEAKTVIKGERIEDKFKRYAPPSSKETCPLKSRGINITPEDTLILRQFQTSNGEILGQAETGLSTREYYKVISCIKMAQRANLLPGSENQLDLNGVEVPTSIDIYLDTKLEVELRFTDVVY